MNKSLSIRVVTLFIITMLLTLVACTSYGLQPPVTPVGMPDVGIPVGDLNQKIGVDAPRGWNSFKMKDSIVLGVRVISTEKVSFNPADTRVFLYENGQWKELQNQLVYSNQADFVKILDPAQKDDFTKNIVAAGVNPNYPDPNKPALLRIFVFGYIYENGAKTEKKVATYTDVNIKP